MATIPGFPEPEATILLTSSLLRSGKQQIQAAKNSKSRAWILLAYAFCFLSTASSSPLTTLHFTSYTDLETLLCLKLHLSDTSGAMASWSNDSSVQYCRWPGVTCSKRHASRVVILNFDSANLSGQIPPCVGSLTFLRAIHLPNNQLNGHIPPELGSLNRLSYLNISYNNLTGTIPSTLSSCSQLRFIDLSNNLLEGEITTSLMGNKSSQLEEIILSNNKLNGIIPPQLGSMNRLSYLDLSYNNLMGMVPGTLSFCSYLQYIDLSNNLLEGEIPSSLMSNKSSQLQEIILSNNKL